MQWERLSSKRYRDCEISSFQECGVRSYELDPTRRVLFVGLILD